MSDFYRELFHPTKEEIIAGYERMIEKKEQEIQVWKEYVRKLKGQAMLTGSNETSEEQGLNKDLNDRTFVKTTDCRKSI